MPKYQCHFLDENDRVVRVENLGFCFDDSDAHREAMTLLAKIGHFTRYELWEEARRVDVHKPVKSGAAL
jgi:hypothetical protein